MKASFPTLSSLFSRVPSGLRALLLPAVVLCPLARAAEPAPLYVFSHLAGPLGGFGNSDGTGAAARFQNPTGIAVDSNGNLFVADVGGGRVRKITPTGVVTTVLTNRSPQQAGLLSGMQHTAYWGIAVDPQDNLYVSDRANDVIFKLTPVGVLSIFTGQTGLVLYKNTDGPLAQATVDDPCGMTFDAAGNLYFADTFNHVIRKITPQGVVSTYAGTTPQHNHPQGAGVTRTRWFPGSADGPALTAQFYSPSAVAADSTGNLYVADTWNHTLRKIAVSGEVTTLAGLAGQSGSVDGTGSAARFNQPNGVTVDSAGNVYVADSGNGTVRKITSAGTVTTLAGAAGDFRSADGTGGAARFVSPKGLTLDRSGRVLVGDGSSLTNPLDQAGTIRRLTTDGVVTTLAGLAGAIGSTDGKGEAARFRNPADVAIDAAGNVFVSDDLNHTIRKITPDGTTTTFAGIAGSAGHADGAPGVATFNGPTGLAFDGNGQLFVADCDNQTIRKISPNGTVSTLAGQPGVAGATDGEGSAARFHDPLAVAVDAAGNVYVGDGNYFPTSGDPARQFSTIRKIKPNGEVSTLAGDPQIVPYEQTRLNFDGTGANARFGGVAGLVLDPDGNLLVADYAYGRIRKVTPGGVVTSLSLVDAAGAPAGVRAFYGITRDKNGNLFATDATSARFSPDLSGIVPLYCITPAGVITPLAGNAGEIGSADGAGTAAQFNRPAGLKIDAQGNLYLADTDNNAIRKGTLAGPPVITTQPQNQTVTAGSNVQFSVTVTGVPAPTYQWYFNGTPYSGATGSSLSFSNARASDAGDYTVTATNTAGNVTSNKATLTVTTAPPSPPAGGGNGGGGGGAPSLWFVGLLAILAAGRSLRICFRRAH